MEEFLKVEKITDKEFEIKLIDWEFEFDNNEIDIVIKKYKVVGDSVEFNEELLKEISFLKRNKKISKVKKSDHL